MTEILHYGMIGVVDNLRYETLEDSLKLVFRAYAIRGFRIVMVLVGMKLKTLKMGIQLVLHLVWCQEMNTHLKLSISFVLSKREDAATVP